MPATLQYDDGENKWYKIDQKTWWLLDKVQPHILHTRFILYCPRPRCQDGNEKAKWDTLACRWEPRDDEDEDEDEVPSVSPGFRGNSTSPPNIEAPEVSAGPKDSAPTLDDRVAATTNIWLTLDQAQAVLTPEQLQATFPGDDEDIRGDRGGGGAAAEDFTGDHGEGGLETNAAPTPGLPKDELQGFLTLIEQSPASTVQVGVLVCCA